MTQELGKLPLTQESGKLPCFFNGVKVRSSARLHTDVIGGRCCPTCTSYAKKRGTSLDMPSGTPVVAIADMKLITIKDNSAEQKSEKRAISLGKMHGRDHSQGAKIMKPYDDIQMWFIDKNGNIILYYHIKETNFIKGLNKGNCKIPKEYKWGRISGLAKNCGGYSKEIIKNNYWVKKGQVIGLSGATGRSQHISLGISIPPSERFKNYLIGITTARVTAHELFRSPWNYTKNTMRNTAPQRDFDWESLPTTSEAYLFPVMSKKYLEEINY